MYIRSLSLMNLRNHEQTDVEFSPEVNIIEGENGAGKTTILEGISICGLSKSFLPTSEPLLIRQGADFYRSSASAESSLGVTYKIAVQYTAGSRKLIGSSIGENLSPKDIIGEMPLVVLSPDFKEITFGSPDNRRRFIDMLLSQSSKRYAEESLNLKRILKQRNNLLSQGKLHGNINLDLLDVWTSSFIETSAEIAYRRMSFIREFTPYFIEAYRGVAGEAEPIVLRYDPDSLPIQFTDSNPTLQDIEAEYLEIANRRKIEEMRRGVTVFGAQKDDLYIGINGGNAREIASQGQHKSLLIALKTAEFEFIRAAKDEMPIMLFDDIFSELDSARTSRVFENIICSHAQTFITTTESDSLRKAIPDGVQSAFSE
ncbi:MAG: DNA replication and repair protein RecF [Ignavibacteria bacterium]|nr:DNA replication and repair protein RecF [Ignavibacteria bacterium]